MPPGGSGLVLGVVVAHVTNRGAQEAVRNVERLEFIERRLFASAVVGEGDAPDDDERMGDEVAAEVLREIGFHERGAMPGGSPPPGGMREV